MMPDCVNNKIDSNVTGLSFAEEVCAKQLPTVATDGYLPSWYELEPNSYADFGGDLVRKARSPLSARRQRKKGNIIDQDAVGGFNMDFTQRNHNRLLQGFFFADFREKTTTKPLNGAQVTITGVTASDDRFVAASGLGSFRAGQLVKVSGSAHAANNGLKTIDEVAATYIGVAESLTDEAAPGEIIISVVGEALPTADASMAVTGAVGTLTLTTTPVAASGVLTIDATFNAVVDETVTIGSVVYTFKAAAAAAYEVTIGSSRLQTIANLAATINGDNLLTPDAHPLVTAEDGADGTMTVTASIAGTVGNSIATTDTGTNMSWGATTLAAGTGFSFYSLDLSEGEWVYLGGDAAGKTFVNNQGYARVNTISDTELSFDKTTWDVIAEAATGLSLHIFTGAFLKNEATPELITTRYFQFERTLGSDDDGVQAEYIRGSVANELTLNLETADFITADLAFVANDATTRSGADGVKDGTRYASLGEDAYNTSSNIVRMNMNILDAADSNPTSLFAYVTEGNLTITNNVSPVKVIGHIGGIDVTSGNFDVGGEVTALFTSVAAIQAVHDNADVTFDLIAAQANEGFVWDIPLLGLGGGRPAITANEPVTLPLTQEGAENSKGYTASYTNFDYLPDAAMPEEAAAE